MIRMLSAVVFSVLLLIVPAMVGSFIGGWPGFLVGAILGVVLAGGLLLIIVPRWDTNEGSSSLRDIIPTQGNWDEEGKD